MGEEKDRDLFIWDVPNIDRAVNAVTRLIPIDLSGCDRRTHAWPAVAELDGQGLAFEDNRNAMKRIYVPSGGFAAGENHPTYKRSSTMMKRLFDHSIALKPILLYVGCAAGMASMDMILLKSLNCIETGRSIGAKDRGER